MALQEAQKSFILRVCISNLKVQTANPNVEYDLHIDISLDIKIYIYIFLIFCYFLDGYEIYSSNIFCIF
jgi:hypothetical protein